MLSEKAEVLMSKNEKKELLGDSNPGPPAPKAGIIATRPNSQALRSETIK